MTMRIQGNTPPVQHKQIPPKLDRSFETFLQEAWQKPTDSVNELKVSKHAMKRLEQRGIELSPADMTKLQEAVVKMEEKGARQSLLLYDDLALITSIHNRTIITALKTSDVTEITDIDSAMIVTK